MPADLSQKIVFKKKVPKIKEGEGEVTEKKEEAATGGYDVDSGKPSEEKKVGKKKPKKAQLLSFQEDDEDE